MVARGPIAILGGGSWGTALALSLRRGDTPARLWARRPELAEQIRAGANPRYLPGVELPRDLVVLDDLEATLDGAGAVLLALPSRAIGPMAATLARLVPGLPVVCAAKGLAPDGRRLSELMADALDPRLCTVLVGPSHAEEVAREHPTAIVLAGGDAEIREGLQTCLAAPALRIYTNDDLPGVEYAAALKNVLAIAAGICDGVGLGDNTKGALLTRGIAEIARLGEHLGGRRDTFYGLSGIGDVITTCLSRHSRNRALGERVGRGMPCAEAEAEIGQVVEGVATARTVATLSRLHGVAMPISEEVERVLFEGRAPAEAIEALMGRSLKSEREIPPQPESGRSEA